MAIKMPMSIYEVNEPSEKSLLSPRVGVITLFTEVFLIKFILVSATLMN